MKTKSTIYTGDCLEVLKKLPDSSVHCCVTSPPYFRQRDYGVDGQLGSEATVEEFVQNLIDVFNEVKRVLHPSGVLWLNIGDGYAAGGKGGGGSFMQERAAWRDKQTAKGFHKPPPGLKRKDLIGAPWEVALALRRAGWYLRADCIWYRRNAMPGSYDDRPIVCHEYVFLLSKSERYFYDNEAVRQVTGDECSWEEYIANNVGSFHNHEDDEGKGRRQVKREGFKSMNHPNGRNLRTVWDIPTAAGFEGHYASFPEGLPELCIKAGSSERGVCPTCLEPWQRVFEDLGSVSVDGGNRKRTEAPGAELSQSSTLRTGRMRVKRPTGWRQACKCAPADPVPSVVIDPFNGTATTGIVAARLSRSYVGIELNPTYVELSRRRLSKEMTLFNEVEIA